MKKVIKQVSGIDVAQKELVACFGKMYDDLSLEKAAVKTFVNSLEGFQNLLAWTARLQDPDVRVRFVMEATGVYHQKFAYWLHDQEQDLSIVVPNKISNYARTLTVKTVTDKSASEAIFQFGAERQLDNWVPPKKMYKSLQKLTRERQQLIDERTVIKNQMHAERAEADPSEDSIERMGLRIELLIRQERDIKKELAEVINSDQDLKNNVKLLRTIPGIGELTAASILGETNGFELIRNKKQLASYAGLDIVEKQSGTSVRGKTRISKRGNRNLRKAMHMPALTALRSNERYKAIFARLVSRHGIKMKAAVAIQRKLLEMSYTIFKNQQPFDKKYFENNAVCEATTK